MRTMSHITCMRPSWHTVLGSRKQTGTERWHSTFFLRRTDLVREAVAAGDEFDGHLLAGMHIQCQLHEAGGAPAKRLGKEICPKGTSLQSVTQSTTRSARMSPISDCTAPCQTTLC